MYLQWLFVSVFVFNISCGNSDLGQRGSSPPSHQLLHELLIKYVDGKGEVDYPGLIKDKSKLERYLHQVSQNPPDRSTWTKEEQLAYWINAYNAFTLKLIIDHYPVKSIKDLNPKLSLPLVNTIWQVKFFQIGGKDASLDEIENKILRKEFNEPRIHFAINCASFSCPPLLNEAFVAEKIEDQLESVTRNFINDPVRNKIQNDKIEISQIFSWFKEDFTKKGSLIDYLNRYSKTKIIPNAKVTYLNYDWSLNE